ncbi:MAG: glycosyltransferase family 39 protein [Bryobacterales bacterium]
MNPTLPRVYALAAASFIAAYFVYFSIGSLLAEFTHDDLMNCYRAWIAPFPELLTDNLLFFRFTPTYRPFGAVLYKLSFGLFGFELFPLRVLLLLVLAANVFLIYKISRILTGSVEVGLFAALLHAYHMKLAPLLYNTGTLYDIFAFFFYFAAVAFYVSIRRSGKNLHALQGLVFLALYILALDSKELAASLPLTLIAYELLWHPPSLNKPALLHCCTRQTWLIWVMAAMTVAFAIGRVFNEDAGISSLGRYGVTVSAGEYLNKTAFYLNEFFYSTWFDATRVGVFAVLLLAAGALSRSRALAFGAVVFFGGILPMAFIDPRALSAVYIPLAGLSIYGGVLLGFACNRLRRMFARQAWQIAAFFAVFGLTGLFLIRVHPHNLHIYAAYTAPYSQIRDAREQLQRLHPDFPIGSSVLVVDTPFPQYSPGYNNLFLMRLAYHDESLNVQEKAMLEKNQEPLVPTNYNYLLSYENGRWFDVDPPTLEAGQPGTPAATNAR